MLVVLPCAAAVAWSASVCSFSATQKSEPFSGSGLSKTGPCSPCSSDPLRSSCSSCSSCSSVRDLLLPSGAGVEGVDGVDGMLMLGVEGVTGPLASWFRPLAAGWMWVWSWGESGSVCWVTGECCRWRSRSSCFASCSWERVGHTHADKRNKKRKIKTKHTDRHKEKQTSTEWRHAAHTNADTKKDRSGLRKQTHNSNYKFEQPVQIPCGLTEPKTELKHFQMSWQKAKRQFLDSFNI